MGEVVIKNAKRIDRGIGVIALVDHAPQRVSIELEFFGPGALTVATQQSAIKR